MSRRFSGDPGGAPHRAPNRAAEFAGRGFAAGFRAIKAVRPVRPIHPRGISLVGELTGTAPRAALGGPSGSQRNQLARRLPARDRCEARFSRSVGLPESLPDILGLALRVASGASGASGSGVIADGDIGAAGAALRRRSPRRGYSLRIDRLGLSGALCAASQARRRRRQIHHADAVQGCGRPGPAGAAHAFTASGGDRPRRNRRKLQGRPHRGRLGPCAVLRQAGRPVGPRGDPAAAGRPRARRHHHPLRPARTPAAGSRDLPVGAAPPGTFLPRRPGPAPGQPTPGKPPAHSSNPAAHRRRRPTKGTHVNRHAGLQFPASDSLEGDRGRLAVLRLGCRRLEDPLRRRALARGRRTAPSFRGRMAAAHQ